MRKIWRFRYLRKISVLACLSVVSGLHNHCTGFTLIEKNIPSLPSPGIPILSGCTQYVSLVYVLPVNLHEVWRDTVRESRMILLYCITVLNLLSVLHMKSTLEYCRVQFRKQRIVLYSWSTLYSTVALYVRTIALHLILSSRLQYVTVVYGTYDTGTVSSRVIIQYRAVPQGSRKTGHGCRLDYGVLVTVQLDYGSKANWKQNKTLCSYKRAKKESTTTGYISSTATAPR